MIRVCTQTRVGNGSSKTCQVLNLPSNISPTSLMPMHAKSLPVTPKAGVTLLKVIARCDRLQKKSNDFMNDGRNIYNTRLNPSAK